MAFVEITSLDDKKKTYRALKNRRDSYSVEIATILDMPKIWVIDQVDFDDPRLSHIKDDFLKVTKRLHELYWEIEREEAIRDGTFPHYIATRKAYCFLDSQPDKGIQFLQKHNLTTHGLIYELLENPNYLEETAHVTYLPVARVEDDTIFVKTIRGIEPCRKANLHCENVKIGDFALCKSIHNTLFMVDYLEEVSA